MLLEKLGGPHAVQSALAAKGVVVKPVTARSWALPGRAIPAKYWAHIQEIAATKGVTVSFAELAESVKVPSDRAA